MATHDVGDDLLLFEAPEPVPQAAVTDLDLVGDGEAAVTAHRRVHLGEVAVGKGDSSGVAVERLADERSCRSARGGQLVDDGGGFGPVAHGVGAAVPTAVGVGRVHGVDPAGAGGQGVGVVLERGGDRVGGVCPAVVCLAQCDDIVLSGGADGQPEAQIHRLGTGVDQEHRVQRFGKEAGETFGELHH